MNPMGSSGVKFTQQEPNRTIVAPHCLVIYSGYPLKSVTIYYLVQFLHGTIPSPQKDHE